MTTIKERAKECIEVWQHSKVEDGVLDDYVERALAEQDRIARQEEREKCIKRAIEVHCAICSKLGCGCRTTDCRDETIIRDAMEGGEIEL